MTPTTPTTHPYYPYYPHSCEGREEALTPRFLEEAQDSVEVLAVLLPVGKRLDVLDDERLRPLLPDVLATILERL